MVRYSLNYVGWKERKAVAADLRLIYRAATEAEAAQALMRLSPSGIGNIRRSARVGGRIGRS